MRKKVNDENRYLLIFRLGKWDLPKGKLDPGETPEQCAVREIEEECGIGKLTITGALPDTWHMYQIQGIWVLKKTYWFDMITDDNRVLKPAFDEHIKRAEWKTKTEVVRVLPGSYSAIADLLRQVFLRS